MNEIGQNTSGADWFEGVERVINSDTPLKPAKMNTTLRGGNTENSAPKNSSVRQSLVNSYYEMGKQAGGTSVGEAAAPKKKGISVFMIVAAVELALLIAVGVLAIIFIPKWLGDPEADAERELMITQAVEGVQMRVNAVYADASKTSLIEGYSAAIIDDIRIDIVALPEGADASGIEAEIFSISKFNSDDTFLKTFEGEGYNVASDFVLSACNYVQTDMLTYSVSGLQTSMKTRVNALLNERALYFKLLSELQAVDVKSGTFDAEGYRTEILGITHTLNRDELLAYVDLIVAKINSAKAGNAYSEIMSTVQGEVDEETQKKIDAAQAVLSQAKEVVVAAETSYTKAKEAATSTLTAQRLVEVLPSIGVTSPVNGEDTTSEVESAGETSEANSLVESSVESSKPEESVSSGTTLEDM